MYSTTPILNCYRNPALPASSTAGRAPNRGTPGATPPSPDVLAFSPSLAMLQAKYALPGDHGPQGRGGMASPATSAGQGQGQGRGGMASPATSTGGQGQGPEAGQRRAAVARSLAPAMDASEAELQALKAMRSSRSFTTGASLCSCLHAGCCQFLLFHNELDVFLPLQSILIRY